MNFVALGKHTLTFSSSLFDVVSDVINSLNFLGYYKNTTDIDSFYTNRSRFLENFTYIDSGVCNNTLEREVEENDQVHQIWGILSMVLVFLPGIVGGFCLTAVILYEAAEQKSCKVAQVAQVFVLLVVSIMFPFAFLISQLTVLVMVCMNEEIDQDIQFFITGITNIEASVESVGQLCLQLFTILYGYPSGLIQKITICTSFIQIARCAILNDIEANLVADEKQLTFCESFWEIVQRLPAYVTTIIFKVASLALCMAYLRVYSIIPMIVLIFEQGLITWIRVKKQENWPNEVKALFGFYLIFNNIGVVNAYTLFNGMCYWIKEFRLRRIKEKEEEIINFVCQLSIVTFIHHSTVLVSIMLIGWNYPDTFEHWTSPKFLLSPCEPYFYFVFTVVLLIGVYSLTVILYRARNISTVRRKETVTPINEIFKIKEKRGNADEDETHEGLGEKDD